jgi:hypothetical protein
MPPRKASDRWRSIRLLSGTVELYDRVIHTRIGLVNMPRRSVAGHAAAAPLTGLKTAGDTAGCDDMRGVAMKATFRHLDARPPYRPTGG